MIHKYKYTNDNANMQLKNTNTQMILQKYKYANNEKHIASKNINFLSGENCEQLLIFMETVFFRFGLKFRT